MAKRSSGIFKHSSGQWAKTYKRKRYYLGCGSLRDAQKKLDEIIARDTLGISQDASEGMTVSQLCTIYLKTKAKQVKAGRFAESTLTGYKKDLDWLCKHLGRRRVDNLKGYDFTLLMDELSGYKATAINTKITRVKAMLNWAVQQDIIEQKPSLGDFKLIKTAIKRIERSGAGSRVFTQPEASCLIEGANGIWKAIMLLGLNCAMEGAEIGRLRHDDIEGEWLSKPRGKTGIQRTCWLWPETREAIKEHRSDDPKLLFLNRYGNPFSVEVNPQCISRPFKILKDRIGLDRPVGFHAWRRTFATVASTLPVSERTIREITAHANNDMLHDHYIEGVNKPEIKKCCQGVRFWLLEPKEYEVWRDIKTNRLDQFRDSETDEIFASDQQISEVLGELIKGRPYLV